MQQTTRQQHEQPDTDGGQADNCKSVIKLVAAEKRVPTRLLVNRYRCRTTASRARQLAMYLSHVALGRSLAEVSLAFLRDRTTVSHACALIEEMREDPQFDAEVSRLEQAIAALKGFDHVG